MTETKLDELLSASPIPMILIGADQRIACANPGAEDMFGTGLALRHYMTVLRQPALHGAIEAVMEGREDRVEARISVTQAIREAGYKATIAKVEGPGGRMTMVSFVDVTDVQEAGQIRRDFVANVSHELKTPLTALLGFIETLRGAAKDDEAARSRFLEVMESEANRMNRLVADLLSLSRVESEQRVRPIGPVDVAGLLRSTANSLRPLAEDAGCEIVLGSLEDAVMVPGDADQLAQVFANLVENAVKYGGQGTQVTLTLDRISHDPKLRGPAVSITVSDDGHGFDPIHIPRLTERFYRVDDHRSRALGGTGLGLAIVKHIVNRHRGRLHIESTPGKGSRFTMSLPVN